MILWHEHLAFMHYSTFLWDDITGLLSLMPFLLQVTEKNSDSFQTSFRKTPTKQKTLQTFPWCLLFSIIFVPFLYYPSPSLQQSTRLPSIYHTKLFTPAMTVLKKTQLLPPAVPRENQITHWVTENSSFCIFRILKRVATILSANL